MVLLATIIIGGYMRLFFVFIRKAGMHFQQPLFNKPSSLWLQDKQNLTLPAVQ